MTLSLVILSVFAAFFVGLFLWSIGVYNSLVTLRNRFKNAFSQIDVQLKRRYDLIPNLVETAKAYLSHERETLEAVIAARNGAASAGKAAATDPGNPEAIKTLMGAETALSGALSKFFALSEAYPDLKANQNMAQLSEELSSTENKIAFSRQAYNDSVMTYNTKREQFPAVLISGPLGFKEAQLFEVTDDRERDAVKVQF